MPSEVRKLKHFEEENRHLRKLVADLTLDKEMLTEVIKKSSDRRAGTRVDRPYANVLPRFGSPRLQCGTGAAVDLPLSIDPGRTRSGESDGPFTARRTCPSSIAVVR